MTVFRYDKTFEGLLSALFDVYRLKRFPDALLGPGEPPPLFHDGVIEVGTTRERADRAWRGLERKLSPSALACLTYGWLSELPHVDLLLLRYMKKAIDAPSSIELDFGDPVVLEVSNIWKKVNSERHKAMQFLRFQKAADGTYFAAMRPLYNVLSLIVPHLRDRFADQRWLVYDVKREYGYYHDLSNVAEVRFEEKEKHLLSGFLGDDLMAKDEKLFQQLWKTYFNSTCIRERLNPRLHRQNMPARFWKYLPEKR